MAPKPAFNKSEIDFNKQSNEYTCPQGNKSTTNGNWYKKERNTPGRKKSSPIHVRHFTTTACKTCQTLNACT